MSSHPANKWCVYIPTQATVCWHRLFTTLDTSTEPPGDSLWELWCWQHLTTFWTSIFGIFHLNYSEQLSASPKGNLPKTTCQDSQNQGFWNASLRKNEETFLFTESQTVPQKTCFSALVGIIRGANGCNSSLKLGEDFYFPMILSVHSRAEWLKRIVQTALILHQIILCHLSWDYRSLTSTGSLRNSHK